MYGLTGIKEESRLSEKHELNVQACATHMRVSTSL